MTKQMTSGNPAKLICLFALPLLMGNIFQQFYSMTDTMIVGRTISPTALAAVGCTGSLSYCILGFASGFTSGLSLVMARYVGADDKEGIKRSFATGLIICAGTAILLTAIALTFAKPLLILLRTPDELLEQAATYITIVFIGISATILYNYSAAIMHAFGNSKAPLFFLIICSCLNVILDLLFILQFQMGVAGAALATVIAQFLSGILCMSYALKKIPDLHINVHHFRIAFLELYEHLRIAYPKGFNAAVVGIGIIVVQFTLNQHGADAVAAYTAAGNINNTYLLVSSSLGTSMATFVSQNYGAQKYSRIRSGIFQCLGVTVGISIAAGILIRLADRSLATLFVGPGETAILDMVETFLSIHCALYWIQALLMILLVTVQSLGNSLIPTIAGILELLMRSGCSLYLGNRFGFTGLCFANPCAWLIALIPIAITCYILMKRMLRRE